MRLIERGARSAWQGPRMALVAMVVGAIAGGLATGFSLAFHTRLPATIHSTIVSNQPPPTQIVVAVRGTPSDPGFLGMVVELEPARQAVRLTPISPALPVVRPDGQRVPLWQAASQPNPKAVTAAIRKATGIPFHYYFYVPQPAMLNLLAILYAAAPRWPSSWTPAEMETVLGYPAGRPRPVAEVALLTAIERQLPTVPEKTMAPLLAAIKESQTNLSPYQMFELANYFRGGHLYPGPLLAQRLMPPAHGPSRHSFHATHAFHGAAHERQP